jgi:hypothetical protein
MAYSMGLPFHMDKRWDALRVAKPDCDFLPRLSRLYYGTQRLLLLRRGKDM